MSKKRELYIDIAKCLAIFLVVLGHMVPGDSTAKVVIYSFHMPLFFILSGFFIKDATIQWKQYKEICSKRFYQLMVPFILWGLVYASFNFKCVLLLLYGSRASIIAAGSLSSLWFLPVLYLASLIVYGVHIIPMQRRERTLSKFVFTALFFCIPFVCPSIAPFSYPWGINVAFMAASYLLMGGAIHWLMDKLKQTYIAVVILVAAIVIFAITSTHSTSAIGYMRMADANFGSWDMCLISALTGSIAVLLFSKLIEFTKISCERLCDIGKHTLGIFLIHKFFINIIKAIESFSHTHTDNIVILTVLAFMVMTGSYVVVLFIEKNIPQLLGKKQ